MCCVSFSFFLHPPFPPMFFLNSSTLTQIEKSRDHSWPRYHLNGIGFCSKISEDYLSFHVFLFYPMDFIDIFSKYVSDFYLLFYSYIWLWTWRSLVLYRWVDGCNLTPLHDWWWVSSHLTIFTTCKRILIKLPV